MSSLLSLEDSHYRSRHLHELVREQQDSGGCGPHGPWNHRAGSRIALSSFPGGRNAIAAAEDGGGYRNDEQPNAVRCGLLLRGQLLRNDGVWSETVLSS